MKNNETSYITKYFKKSKDELIDVLSLLSKKYAKTLTGYKKPTSFQTKEDVVIELLEVETFLYDKINDEKIYIRNYINKLLEQDKRQ